MHRLTKAEFEVLNAAGDDFENLDQIYRLVCTDFSSERDQPDDPTASWGRDRTGVPSLTEIADVIWPLVNAGLLEARTETGQPGDSDPLIAWKGWFRTTKAGLAARDAAVEFHPR
jgi:hypothetical protein